MHMGLIRCKLNCQKLNLFRLVQKWAFNPKYKLWTQATYTQINLQWLRWAPQVVMLHNTTTTITICLVQIWSKQGIHKHAGLATR